MIIITDVTYIYVDKPDYVRLNTMGRVAYGTKALLSESDAYAPSHVDVTAETIRGNKFINRRGDEFIIGMTQAVQDFIGLPAASYQMLSSRLTEARDERDAEYAKVTKMQNAGLLTRIKWVFTGVKA